MADDSQAAPPPRPRRRRTDWDPNAKPPKVAYERRRSRRAAEPPAVVAEAVAAEAVAAEAVAAEALVPDVVADSEPAAEVVAEGAREDAPAAVAPEAVIAQVSGGAAEVDGQRASGPSPAGTWLPLFDGRSPNAWVCPFLRSTAEDGSPALPIESPDAANRCAALSAAVPQSLRQQELVCLTTNHVNCPRYLRGAATVTEAPVAAVRAGRTLSPAILGSLVLLVLAFAASFGFVMSRGGLDLAVATSPSPEASASGLAAASPTTEPAATATPSAEPAPTSTPAPTPSPTVAPTPEPTPEPTAEPTAEPTPEPTPEATPRSDRYALLTPCPDAPRCWIYVVRRGDNVYSIARYFGVPESRVYAMNPWLETTGLRAGQELRLPPPTR